MKVLGNSVAVIGCGWLGVPLGQKLLKLGWTVHGSTTRIEKLKQLIDDGIQPYLLNLPERPPENMALFHTDILILNISTGRKDPQAVSTYPEIVQMVLNFARHEKIIKKIIFISSTSVYGTEVEEIDESNVLNPGSDSAKALQEAEALVLNSGIPSVILRFGGLAGPGRHPGRFLAGRKGLPTGNQAVNFLHLDDAIRVILHMMEHHVTDQIFNVVAPVHPTKAEFYTKMAELIGLEPPVFTKGEHGPKRVISVKKLVNNTGFTFIYPDPMKFSFN